MFDQLCDSQQFWKTVGSKSDVVLSTRLRLARNRADFPFPNITDYDAYGDIEESLQMFMQQSQFSEKLAFHKISDLHGDDARFLRECNIISEELESNGDASFLYERDQKFVIHANAVDHFRIQVIRAGMSLYESYRDIVKVDEELNTFVEYAYNGSFGYLTSSLDSVGSGLKVSALLHLPANSYLEANEVLSELANNLHVLLKPLSGSLAQNSGALYILENSNSAEQNETELIETISDVVDILVDLEYDARDQIVTESAHDIEDLVWRSYGILSFSRSLSYREALEHLSNIRLGVILNTLTGIPIESVYDMMINIQTGHLIKRGYLDPNKVATVDTQRASYLRTQFSQKV